jgi:Lipocalin-like domain
MKYSICLLLLAFVSCGSPNPDEMKDYLNGYWEIEKVKLPDGSEKSFSLSTTIDYMEVKGDSGIRKKVAPQLDGTFLTFDQNETFNTSVRHDSLILHYKTPFDQWEETVIKASKSELVVRNKDQKEYHYKPFTSIHTE